MSRFTNKKCPVCRAPFTDNADIVVCPKCGTPHHRACWLQNNRCGVEKYHEQGFVWNGFLPDETTQPAPSDTENSDPHKAVYPAGTPQPRGRGEYAGMNEINDPQEYYSKLMKLVTDDARGDDGVSLHELCAFAGKSVFHYGRAFSVFRGEFTGRKSSVFMNFCAGLFSPVFQFYRKMDVLGVITLLLGVLFMLPELLAAAGVIQIDAMTEASQAALGAICVMCNFFGFLLTVILCLFGDYLYYKHAIKQIKKIREKFGADGEEGCEEYFRALVECGKPSWLRAVVGFLLMMLCTACIRYLPAILLNG